MNELSIIIPARNEMFIKQTVENLLANKSADTDIIVGLDGAWAKPEISQHPDVNVIYFNQSVGQRVASNWCARLSRAKYIMKVDAHCSFDEGFDAKMIALMKDDITMVPVMRNLHAFDWVCPDGHHRYQSPSGPCREPDATGKPCGKPTTMDIKWIGKTNPQSTAYRFDRNMHFQYWSPFGKSQKGDLTETLSLQGSCFMATRKKYFELGLCGDEFSSWGQQGVEVACKTWLSGGRVLVNRTTWYAHMFRTQGGDFGFPYHIRQHLVDKNRELSRDLFINNKWPKAKRSFQWLIQKFQPPEWEDVWKPDTAQK